LCVDVQLTTFAVLTIVGAVLGLIQLVIAALGASAMDKYFDEYANKKIADIDCGDADTEDAKALCAQVAVVGLQYLTIISFKNLQV